MGAVVRHVDNTHITWTGGKPLPDWSGLVNPDPVQIYPTQYRQNSIGSSIKNQYYRTKGLDTKFSGKSDLLIFQKELTDHLEMHGMDSISYLPDPSNPIQMISVMSNHAQFTLRQAKAAENVLQSTIYDQYDKANIKDAKKVLINSMDETLKKQMFNNCDDTNSIVYWMNFTLLIESVLIQHFDRVKNRIKARKIQDYPGQNITELASDYIADWKTLHGARMYDNSLTLIMLDTIMKAGDEDFKSELRPICRALGHRLLEVRENEQIKRESQGI